jgi:hypothetical protein
VDWPGTTFTLDTDEGLALLGTPNALGVGWLLAQHEEAFGEKRVTSITVWQKQYLYMLINIG